MTVYDELERVKAENENLKNVIANIDFDLGYYKSILDGSWPSSVRILTESLRKAKALKGDFDGTQT